MESISNRSLYSLSSPRSALLASPRLARSRIDLCISASVLAKICSSGLAEIRSATLLPRRDLAYLINFEDLHCRAIEMEFEDHAFLAEICAAGMLRSSEMESHHDLGSPITSFTNSICEGDGISSRGRRRQRSRRR